MPTIDLQGRIHPSDSTTTPNIPDNETILVDLITKLYNTLRLLGPHEPDSMIWPPPEGHNLNLPFLPARALIDPRIVSLMKHLPIYRHTYHSFMPNIQALDLMYRQELLQSRIANVRNYDEVLTKEEYVFAPATVVVLFRGQGDVTPLLVLDIADNTIRWVGDACQLEDDYTKTEQNKETLLEYRYNYKDWPAMSAPLYFKRVLENFHEGVWIPSSGGYIDHADPENNAKIAERQRLLKDEYGWPDNFREEAWKEDLERRE